MDKYMIDLLNYSSKLDAMANECGEITKLASNIVDKNDIDSTKNMLRKISKIAFSKDYSLEVKKIAAVLKDSLVKYYGHIRILEICDENNKIEDDDKSLLAILSELDSLVGLSKVKYMINGLIAYQKIQKKRQENNLQIAKQTLHLAFLGNPGTGKTTVARIIGKIYKHLDLLSKGHFIEVSRTDLIAGYQGQTALKVKSIIEKAKGGVLFIDEAYSITENDNNDSYGRECLTELTKALEDYREDLIVIVAGYTEPMIKFFELNLGLKSRFNTFIEFDDYTADELLDILVSICTKNDYILSSDAFENIKDYLSIQVINKNNNFANGRTVRNIYDNLIMNHARRVDNIKFPSLEDLSLIISADFIIEENIYFKLK